jgi:capsid protein
LVARTEAAAPGLFNRLLSPFLAVYRGAVTLGQRKTAPPGRDSEDRLVPRNERHALTDNAFDLFRNFAPARSMLMKHLNYTTEFRFQGTHADEGWNNELEAFVARRSQSERCTADGQNDLPGLIRVAETMSAIHGDVGLLRLDDATIAGIESDLIASPSGLGNVYSMLGTVDHDGWLLDGTRWVHGVRVDRRGRPVQYSLHKRVWGGTLPDQLVDAADFDLLAYRDRFDQVRGVGLYSSALNLLRDADENIEQSLVKAKLQNAFGVAFFTESPGGLLGKAPAASADATSHEFRLGAGVNLLNMSRGDDVKMLSIPFPPTEFREYMRVVLMLALQAFEIPYGFLDEANTNYSGHRCAWLHYEKACVPKRRRLIRVLENIVRFWLRWGIREKEITLPRGMTPETVPCEWIPVGMPWWKPDEEIRGDLAAIAAGLTTFDRVCRERGTGNVRDNIRSNAAVFQLAKDLQFPLQLVPAGSPPADPATPKATGEDPAYDPALAQEVAA